MKKVDEFVVQALQNKLDDKHVLGPNAIANRYRVIENKQDKNGNSKWIEFNLDAEELFVKIDKDKDTYITGELYLNNLLMVINDEFKRKYDDKVSKLELDDRINICKSDEEILFKFIHCVKFLDNGVLLNKYEPK